MLGGSRTALTVATLGACPDLFGEGRVIPDAEPAVTDRRYTTRSSPPGDPAGRCYGLLTPDS